MGIRFIRSIFPALISVAFALGGALTAAACYDDAGCRALIPNAPQCCCNGNSWQDLPGPPPGPTYADQNACLCDNGFLSYCGGSPSPPGTCAGMGMSDDTIPLCPGNNRCTSFMIGGFRCLCPVGQFWDVDACVPGAGPPPPGICTAFPPASWADHACADTGCAPSEMPAPPPPTGTTFANLTNKMAACCGRGWGENPNGARKLDCVEAVAPPPASPPALSFLDFYMAGAAPNDVTTAGVTYPNQMFVLDENGIPLSGFYTATGIRCGFRHNVTGAPRTHTAQEHLTIYRNSLAALAPTFTGMGPTDVDPSCCNLVVFAMERLCPTQDILGGIRVAATTGGTRRCTAAKQMKLDFAVFDLCDPTITKRTRFRMATSYTGEDPVRATIFPTDAIKIENLISGFYPSMVPMTPPVCPATPAIYEVAWTAGMCRLDMAEPYP